MNLPFPAFAAAAILATCAFAHGQAQPLHLRVTCDSCTTRQSDFLVEHSRASALASDFHLADSADKAPTLRIVVVPVDSAWSMSTSLSSPAGRPIRMSSQEIAPPFETTMMIELDSVLVDAARAVREARQRSRDPVGVAP